MSFLVEGSDVQKLFSQEPGGHRFQRNPPTERRGRIHTSTITVVVLPIEAKIEKSLRESDIEYRTTKGSGPGGQHKNVTESEVIATHKPTGIQVRIGTERSQHKNKAIAVAILAGKIEELNREKQRNDRDTIRRNQQGSGMRGDKVRTVRVQDGIVTCELTGRKTNFAQYSKGNIWF